MLGKQPPLREHLSRGQPKAGKSYLSGVMRMVSERRTRLFALAVVATLGLLILPSWTTWSFYRASVDLSTQVLGLKRLVGTVTHLDEVLTMSARMAAATGDERWEERYRRAEPQLDAAIEETIRLVAGAYSAAAERTGNANRNLVALENRTFDLARRGRLAEATALLESEEYQRNKRNYADGINLLTAKIDERIRRDLGRSKQQVIGAGALTLLSVSALLLAWVGVVALFWRHLAARARAEHERDYLESQIQYMQKLESLGVLAGGIAHDFNNLLMPILGNADLVLTELSADSPHRTRLERLSAAGKRLSELTNQMLAYSGKGAIVVRAVNLSGLVEDMSKLLDISVSKRAELKWELAEDLPAIEGDASQLGQVVMNLVTNASDALGDEGGIIRVRTELVHADRAYLAGCQNFGELSPGQYVCLEVSDSGRGMSAMAQRRVFDPFFTTKIRGRGLGLAVLLGIVRGHHGAIRLESEPLRGTTFRILFPCSERVEEPVVRTPAPTEEWRASGTALVVDDEADVRELAEIMLQRLGFRVMSAQDGQEGVETFRKHAEEIDVVLLDLTMPGLRSDETFREIRRIRPDQRIIAMSGYDKEFVASRLAGEIAVFLQKPFTASDLAETLRPLLEEPDAHR